MAETDLLVIVPHEDDELAIAGAMIYGAVQQNMRIKVVFVTNGDYFGHEGTIRIKEAGKALGELGVTPEDIIFLGYGDQTQTKHLYNSAPDELVASYNGKTETYGTEQTPEFAMTEYGVHHAYTRENYKSDIKAVIAKYHPKILVTTDWDNHMDHLALSLMVDEVLGELLKEEKLWHPLVLKAQAYNGKWEGHADYYHDKNVTELVNEADGTDHIHPMDKWEERIRFAVPRQCRTALIRKNVLYKAAKQYHSQSVDLKAIQFINLDMVYWRRPTESLTYHADIEVSSGNAAYLNDFKCADCSDIIGFARAGLADDGHELAFVDLHGDMVGSLDRRVTHLVILAHVVKLNECTHYWPPPGPPPGAPPGPPPISPPSITSCTSSPARVVVL